MPAPKENKNAEKWTVKTAMDALNRIEQECKKEDCYYLLTALVECGLYSEVWTYWKEKFSSDKVVFQTIKRIEDYLEQKLVKAGLKGDVNVTAFIFVAKCKFGFKEPPTENRNINSTAISEMSDEELDAEIDRLERIKRAIS